MEDLAKFYDERCVKGNKSWDACHWKSRESQINNFELLLQIAPIQMKDTILDVGCGQGDLFPYAKELGAKYHGIDISTKMVFNARRRFPGAVFETADLKDVTGKWDWVFASGTFNHAGQDLDAAMRKMFSLARNGIGLTVLSKYDPVSLAAPCDYLQCHDPVKALETAFSLTRWVNMNHTALEWGFVVFLYTEEYVSGRGG